ncbi:MAG TPA: carboxypeptidase regulatory-like domain-containing protein [Myxococcales bacterium]|nr:carboxypeptidase regulatory-like domain-containing protein [Myxococcales bacterium]
MAQTAAGSLAGVVVDAATQAPLADAQVTARSPALVGEQSAMTDATGAFEMTFLPAGSYTVTVRRDGYQPFTPENLILKGKQKVHVRIAVVAAQTAASVADSALEFNDSMTAPAMISGPAPEYTPEAVERGVQGAMQIRCVVTVEGQVRACKVVKGLPFMNSAVVDSLERRKYKPALAQGKPVDVYYTFNIQLKLPAGQ